MGSALRAQFYSPSHGHTRNAPVLERQEPSVDPLAPARRGEATRSPVTVWVLRSPHPGSRWHPCPGEPRSLALPGAKARCPAPAPRAFPGRPARAPGPGRRFRLAGAGGRAPPRPPPARPAPRRPRPARAPGPRPPTWLSPTQKTRPRWLRHTRASWGCAAAPQKVKEQREARSRCTVVRTSAAGRRPQRTHRYR